MPVEQTPPLLLSPEDLEVFYAASRPIRCEMILRIHHPAMIAAEIKRPSCPDHCLYPIDLVVAATLAWMAWAAANREGGMFRKWRRHEAFTKMLHVVQSAFSGAKSGANWGSVLFQNLDMEAATALSAAELRWWQINAEAVDVARVRKQEVHTHLIAAFRCLCDNQFHIYSRLPPESTSESSPIAETLLVPVNS